MPTEEVNTRELVKKRLDEVLEEIGKCQFGDEKRTKLMAEAEKLTKMLNEMDQVANMQINNNWQNQNNEEKLEVDKKRIELDRKKLRFGKVQLWVSAGIAVVMEVGGYFLNEWFQPDKRMWQTGDKWAGDIRSAIKNWK